MTRPHGNRSRSGAFQYDMPDDPSEGAKRLPPHLAVLAIIGLSLAAWAVVALLAQPFLRAI